MAKVLSHTIMSKNLSGASTTSYFEEVVEEEFIEEIVYDEEDSFIEEEILEDSDVWEVPLNGVRNAKLNKSSTMEIEFSDDEYMTEDEDFDDASTAFDPGAPPRPPPSREELLKRYPSLVIDPTLGKLSDHSTDRSFELLLHRDRNQATTDSVKNQMSALTSDWEAFREELGEFDSSTEFFSSSFRQGNDSKSNLVSWELVDSDGEDVDEFAESDIHDTVIEMSQDLLAQSPKRDEKDTLASKNDQEDSRSYTRSPSSTTPQFDPEEGRVRLLRRTYSSDSNGKLGGLRRGRRRRPLGRTKSANSASALRGPALPGAPPLLQTLAEGTAESSSCDPSADDLTSQHSKSFSQHSKLLRPIELAVKYHMEGIPTEDLSREPRTGKAISPNLSPTQEATSNNQEKGEHTKLELATVETAASTLENDAGVEDVSATAQPAKPPMAPIATSPTIEARHRKSMIPCSPSPGGRRRRSNIASLSPRANRPKVLTSAMYIRRSTNDMHMHNSEHMKTSSHSRRRRNTTLVGNHRPSANGKKVSRFDTLLERRQLQDLGE